MLPNSRPCSTKIKYIGHYFWSPLIMGRLEGKVAWISGATSGIGEATARLFAKEGARVALIGRRLELSRRIAGELKAEGGESLPVACDVSNERPVRDSIRRTIQRFGRL